MSDKTAIVAGNGPSLAAIPPGVVIEDDEIIRTNSFFLEREYYLGDHVDLAFIAGDPRVTPFVFATLQSIADHYRVAAWTSQHDAVRNVGVKYCSRPFAPYLDLPPNASDVIEDLTKRYQAQPTTGVMAMFQAQARGARTIILAGVDLYGANQRYVFEPGKNMRSLLGQNLAARRYDTRLHNRDLDCALIDWVAGQDGLRLYKASPDAPLDLDPAPIRPGSPILPKPKPVTHDWVSWAGWYPIWGLRLLRMAAAFGRSSGLRKPQIK